MSLDFASMASMAIGESEDSVDNGPCQPSLSMVDVHRRVIVVLSPGLRCSSDYSWDEVIHDSVKAVRTARKNCGFEKEDVDHRRGTPLQIGITRGPGSGSATTRAVKDVETQNALDALVAEQAIRRVAGFQSSFPYAYALKPGEYYCSTLNAVVLEHHTNFRHHFKNSDFASLIFNFGPQTVCKKHRDVLDLAWGSSETRCSVTLYTGGEVFRHCHQLSLRLYYSLLVQMSITPSSAVTFATWRATINAKASNDSVALEVRGRMAKIAIVETTPTSYAVIAGPLEALFSWISLELGLFSGLCTFDDASQSVKFSLPLKGNEPSPLQGFPLPKIHFTLGFDEATAFKAFKGHIRDGKPPLSNQRKTRSSLADFYFFSWRSPARSTSNAITRSDDPRKVDKQLPLARWKLK
ncbi:hypothetical protein ONZ45_g18355 [Pleurotus djamor]|nr:hypothetical protein ONZ45_g18355 [Pleurotus djamor]